MKEYFTRTRFEDGKYIVEKVEQISFEVETLQPQKATITHIGAYGQIQFVVNDIAYQTENGNISKRVDTKNVFVNTENLVFNHNIDKLFTVLYQYSTLSPRPYWVEVPFDWTYVPEGWQPITKETVYNPGDAVLEDSGKIVIIDRVTCKDVLYDAQNRHYLGFKMRGIKKP